MRAGQATDRARFYFLMREVNLDAMTTPQQPEQPEQVKQALQAQVSVPTKRLVLGSSSPRRRDLLSKLGLPFEIMSPDVDESVLPRELPRKYVIRMAESKAKATLEQVLSASNSKATEQVNLAIADATAQVPHSQNLMGDLSALSSAIVSAITTATASLPSEEVVVIGADTIVVCQGEIIGKPKNREDAKRIITKLSGHVHEVMTAVAIKSTSGAKFTIFESTKVTFARLTPELIDTYVASGECDDKSGAYALQGLGAMLIESVKGSVSSVVGLPLCQVRMALERCGFFPKTVDVATVSPSA